MELHLFITERRKLCNHLLRAHTKICSKRFILFLIHILINTELKKVCSKHVIEIYIIDMKIMSLRNGNDSVNISSYGLIVY